MRRAHLPRILPVKGVTVVAAADPVAASAEGLAGDVKSAVAVYADYEKMLRDETLDAVVISTPHSQHFEQAAAAMKRGLHVQLEKPLVIHADEAKKLLATAKRKNLILHVAYQRHHLPVYRHIRKLVATGKLGELRSVVGYVTQNWTRAGGWRLDPKLAGGGMFTDTGSHLVAAALFTSGLIVKEVVATVDHAGFAVDINTSVSARCANDAIVSLTTIGNAAAHDERLAIHGSKGSIVVEQYQWAITAVLHNGEPLKLPASLKHDNPDAGFFRWIKAGGKGYELPTYALEVAKISEAAYAAAKAGRTVKV